MRLSSAAPRGAGARAPRVLGILLIAAAIGCAGGATQTSAAAGPRTPPIVVDTEHTPATASGLPADFDSRFRVADQRARAITYWLQCVPTVARLRAGGTFGPAGSAPRAIVCERTADGVPIGGVFDIDSSFRTVRRLQVVQLDGARPRYLGPLDTARVAAGARLARDVTRALTPTWTKRNRPFSAVPIVTDGGALEVWAVPRANKARSYVTGGDVGYTRAADGALAVLEDRTTTWVQLNLAPEGALTIYSSVRDIPAVADLVTARYHAELGRPVTVQTPAAISTLEAGLDPATGSRLVWKHTARTP
jgi:hypothetical protein